MSDLRTPDANDCIGLLPSKAIQGLEFFNARHFFEAHEALESAWREETGSIRNLYRGILQAGVVYLHITQYNYAGAIKVYGRCQKWLRLWPETCRGISVGQLEHDLDTAIAALQKLGAEHIADFDMSLLKPIHYSMRDIP